MNRLIGAGVDIPAAYLERLAARARAKTASYIAVEEAVALAVTQGVAADPTIAHRAMGNLLAKEYRQQGNREAVAREFLNDLQQTEELPTQSTEPAPELDDDWLNVFERYAGDASTDRMQRLWGRVLAGEVRRPGRFSIRTLRFLSEFSQQDALLFADFCTSAFGGIAPNRLVKPEGNGIGNLLDLESAGLVTGGSGLGLERNLSVVGGITHLVEGSLGIEFVVPRLEALSIPACILTNLGKELVELLPSRNAMAAAIAVANAIRQPAITEAYLVHVNEANMARRIQMIWRDSP
ncbi:MAG: DUF2806 domain-containing protein [Sphingomonadaceae bacterium]|nr:DUF2806 domain-containing protein [Sphingomonadaceae bacterium]